MVTNTFAVLAALASLCAGAATDQRHVQPEISWRDGDVVVVQCQIPYFTAWQQKWHTSSVLDLRLSYKQEGDQYKEERVAHLLYGKLLGKDGRFDEDPMVNAQAVETPLGRPALRVTMPLSDQGVFFCHIKYQSSQKSGNVTYSYKIDHGFLEESREVANGSLTLRNVKGHEVNVTWVSGTAGGQTGPAFVLSRGLLDQSNCPVNRPRSDILYLDRGGLPLFNDTLLLDVQSPSEDQKVFQIRLFVKAGVSCSPNCVYYGEASGREWHSQEQNTCVTEHHQKDDDDGYYHLVKNTNSLVIACVCLPSLIIVCIVCWWMKATGITAWVRKCIQNIHCQRQEGGGAARVQAPGANDVADAQRQGGGGGNATGVQGQGGGNATGVQGQGGGGNATGVQGQGGGNATGVQGQGGGGNATGVQGQGGGNATGVQGQGGGGNATGVQGQGGGNATGVQGQGGGGNATGVQGQRGGGNATGVQGQGGGNATGVQGQGGGGNATGVQGQGGGNATGVQGQGGGNATGVQGQGGGNATGVQGQGGGGTATGVQGQGGGGNATGVQGQGGGGNATGVQGQGGGGNAAGVQGQGGGNATGVQRQCGGNATGVQGQGGGGSATVVQRQGGGGTATGVQVQGDGNAGGVQGQGGGGTATGVQVQGDGNAGGVQGQGGGGTATGVQVQGDGNAGGVQGQGGGGTATGVQVQGDGNDGGVQGQGSGGNVTGVQGQIGADGKNALGADVSEKATHVKQYPHSNHATKRNSIRLEECEPNDNQWVSDRDAKENVVMLRPHGHPPVQLEGTEREPLMSDV